MSISPYIFDNEVFTQTSNATPTLPPSYFFSIGAFVPQGVYVTATATYPGPESQALHLISSTRFDFGSPAFASLPDLHSQYQFGTYTVTAFGGQTSISSSVSYLADYFTNTIPTITNFSSLSQFDTSQQFTVHYNSFTPTGPTVGTTFFSITDAITHQVVFSSVEGSSSTAATIPANTLLANHPYTFELDFSDRLNGPGTLQGFDTRTDGTFTTSINHPGQPKLDSLNATLTADINAVESAMAARGTDMSASDPLAQAVLQDLIAIYHGHPDSSIPGYINTDSSSQIAVFKNQCVALVQGLEGIGQTKSWDAKSPALIGTHVIEGGAQPGDPIATFVFTDDPRGTYGPAHNGEQHAAIFLDYHYDPFGHRDGMYVAQQWFQQPPPAYPPSQPAEISLYLFGNPNHLAAASDYWVIL